MKKKKSTIRESYNDRILLILIYFYLSVITLVVLYPLVYIVSASISSPEAVTAGQVWLWPVDFSLEGYKEVLNNSSVMRGFRNSILYTIGYTFIAVFLTIIFAYPLSRKNFYGKKILMIFILFTMLFYGGLIPEYLVVQRLGMLDTPWAILIPKAIAVWQVIIARTFFQASIPEELVEASEMDGCSSIKFLWHVVIPLSKPIIAVLALMYAVFQWNSYFDAMIFLRTEDLFPLQLELREILITQTQSGGNLDIAEQQRRQQLANLMQYSLIVVSSIPVLIIYPFAQKYFVKGMLLGSVKG
ncbi:carbohydrate ABC transporter permease [Gracilibacillus alcaliphilus]|uniref:carbohydrate ABC transporter permease n=1 Tax=Gracilibacillus alcaliphilus TaxID=1401441 RepID=UPI00195660C8|nr:carbohydrate ABC transporter permease [Gracilibacillus alcaliphilus]MBM7677182.1 putative aldouronate transport system permease protein [Gracilibacillus alcaliphilus]